MEASARRASSLVRTAAMRKDNGRTRTSCWHSAARPGLTCSCAPCLPNNCSARLRSSRITLIIVKGRAMRRRVWMAMGLPLLAAASASAQRPPTLFDNDIRNARAEQAAAEAQVAKLAKAAAQARDEASRLRAERQAAAQAIEVAESRIGASDAQLRLAAAYVLDHRRRLTQEQQPIASLLAGLATMGARPPLLALADRGG